MSDPVNTPDSAKPRAGRGIKIALALSLALNLLILGLIGGAILGSGGPRGGPDGPPLRSLGLGPFALALSREDREELRGRIDHGANREEHRAIGESLRQLQTALRAEPFDRALAEQAMQTSRASAERLQANGHSALLDQIEAMDAGTRAALADRLDRALNRVGRWRPDHDRDGHRDRDHRDH